MTTTMERPANPQYLLQAYNVCRAVEEEAETTTTTMLLLMCTTTPDTTATTLMTTPGRATTGLPMKMGYG